MATKIKRTKDGSIDKRTKEGKEIALRMEKARKAKAKNNSITKRIKKALGL